MILGIYKMFGLLIDHAVPHIIRNELLGEVVAHITEIIYA
jgi:hypothetical protein